MLDERERRSLRSTGWPFLRNVILVWLTLALLMWSAGSAGGAAVLVLVAGMCWALWWWSDDLRGLR